MNYLCPICGYDRLEAPPIDFQICPSCGVEFGNDDFEVSHLELRSRWWAKGCPWFSRFVLQPPNWDPLAQLRNLGKLTPGSLSTTVSTTVATDNSANYVPSKGRVKAAYA
jgi:hypothetical protein